jgi:glyoxylase-like metal-dependent hydrolase (beta-lactamase superfamily II)
MKYFIALTLLLLSSYTFANGQHFYPDPEVEMHAQQVGPHSYLVQGGFGAATENHGFVSNAGFIVGDHEVIVIDALGTHSLGWRMLQEIRRITDKPISTVIMTHYHLDHLLGIEVFKDLGATVYAPVGALEWMELPATKQRLEERTFLLSPYIREAAPLIAPDHIINKDETLIIDGLTLNLSFLGDAHSEGDLSVLLVDDSVLYSGDIIFEGRTPYVGDANTKHWLETLKLLEKGNLKVLVPGHGGIAKNPHKAVSLTRHYVEYLRETMGKGVEELRDFAEIYDETDWSEFENLPAFDEANRRNAYQVFLNLEKESF